MRALILLFAIGCGGPGGECATDSDCGSRSLVCARNGECLGVGDVRSVHVTWTIRGETASPSTCATTPDFYILFSAADVRDTFGYEPVPCASGVFSVDKLPTRFTAVEIGVDGKFAENKAFDANGNAAFDLAP